jgi:hypothetical protein
MMRNALVLLAGLAAAAAAIAAIEALGHMIYPLPPGLNVHDRAQLTAYIETLPLPAFLFVLAAWAGGVFAGAGTVALLVKQPSPFYIVIITGLVLLGAIGNMLMLPHPMWFMLAVMVLIPAAGYLGCRLVGSKL